MQVAFQCSAVGLIWNQDKNSFERDLSQLTFLSYSKQLEDILNEAFPSSNGDLHKIVISKCDYDDLYWVPIHQDL